MLNMLEIESADSIIEVGAGGGDLSLEIMLRKKKDAHLLVSDLSHKMCSIAYQRLSYLKKLASTPFGMINFQEKIKNLDLQLESEFDSSRSIIGMNTTVARANNEDLSSIAPSYQYDCYIASLSLMLVADPLKMLSEAYRVLKKGGKAIFSVQGAREGMTYFTLFEDALEKSSFQVLDLSRRAYHLSNKQLTIFMLEETGFKNVKTWEIKVPLRIEGDQQIRKFVEMRFGSLKPEEGTDQFQEKEDMIEKVYSQIKEIFEVEKTSLVYKTIVIFGEKD